MKKILLICTGGTIACRRTPDGLKPLMGSEELLSYVKEAKEFADISTFQLMNIDSTNMLPDDWLTIASCIEKNYEAYDGFVVAHGTDTMAFTSSALSYLIQNSEKPIVITGAQKPIDMDSTDARTNLLDSLRYASEEKAHGVSIVFDGKVIVGTRAKKEHSKSFNAFSSINFPYRATIQDNHVIFYLEEEIFSEPVKFYHTLNENVALLKIIPGMKAESVQFLESFDAVIIESFGVGGIPEGKNGEFAKAIDHLIELGKILVFTTQVTNEGSNMSVYEVGKRYKKNRDVLEGYDMTLESTVAKLMWILGQTDKKEEIRSLFYQTINKDMLYTFE